jgi:Mrp family chromosome partitioning ATPase/predicted Fe-Mo cluster-binding NifX family protein
MMSEKTENKMDQEKLEGRLSRIRHKILILSGKGGVGKSTVAVNLAVALAAAGKKTGLLDVDIHGPSVPKMLGIENMPLHGNDGSINPLEVGDNLRVMSIGLLLRSTDDAVIWRGPMKMNVIKQFLSDVEWGDLDYLVIDSPPGTGDEPLSVAQLVPDADGAVIVTTPQTVALIDVRKCVTFCRQLGLPVIGVVENMSGFVCPHCGERTELFKSGGGGKMADDMNIPFIGAVPFDPAVVLSADKGEPFILKHPESETGKVFTAIAAPILSLKKREAASAPSACGSCTSCSDGSGTTKIGLPVDGGRVSSHFGHAEKFAIIEVDCSKNSISGSSEVVPPPHDEGVLPEWLRDQGVSLVITGGLGRKAKQLFGDMGIDVLTGAPQDDPAAVVRSHLDGTFKAGDNACGHGPGDGRGSGDGHGRGCGEGTRGGCGGR